jgi:uncharacterized membrane protein
VVVLIAVLGWLNITLVGVSFLPFLLRRFRRHVLKKPNKQLNAVLKFLGKLHPFIGITLLITSFIHGYLAVGTIRLHTGYVAWFLIATLFAIRMWGKISKNKYWLTMHRAVAMLLFLSLLLHIFARNIL